MTDETVTANIPLMNGLAHNQSDEPSEQITDEMNFPTKEEAAPQRPPPPLPQQLLQLRIPAPTVALKPSPAIPVYEPHHRPVPDTGFGAWADLQHGRQVVLPSIMFLPQIRMPVTPLTTMSQMAPISHMGPIPHLYGIPPMMPSIPQLVNGTPLFSIPSPITPVPYGVLMSDPQSYPSLAQHSQPQHSQPPQPLQPALPPIQPKGARRGRQPAKSADQCSTTSPLSSSAPIAGVKRKRTTAAARLRASEVPTRTQTPVYSSRNNSEDERGFSSFGDFPTSSLGVLHKRARSSPSDEEHEFSNDRDRLQSSNYESADDVPQAVKPVATSPTSRLDEARFEEDPGIATSQKTPRKRVLSGTNG